MLLVVGILVDDGIVIAENIYTHFQKGKKPHEAAIFMAEGKKNISLIEKKSLSEFLEAIQELNLKVKIVDTIKGYNIAKGRHVEINIFENQMFDQSN